MTAKKENIIGANIKRLRAEMGVTQQKMSHDLYITRSCLGNYEIGSRIPNQDTMRSIAHYFSVDVQDLTEGAKMK